MPAAPDAAGVHPATERFAIDFYNLTPPADWPAELACRTESWERADPEQRVAFRDIARRFMLGDVSLVPWTYVPHMVPRG